MKNDLFKDIVNKFIQKSNCDINSIYFIGDGKIVKENTIIKDLLKNKKEFSIIVQFYNEDNNKNIFIESKEIICQECKEPYGFQIDNYKIKLSNCKNGYIFKNIKLKEFQEKQK